MDRPDLVSDYEVSYMRPFLAGNLMDRGSWAWFIFALRGGQLPTMEEVDEILGKANGLGPHRFEDTWDAVTRSEETSFWRRPQ